VASWPAGAHVVIAGRSVEPGQRPAAEVNDAGGLSAMSGMPAFE